MSAVWDQLALDLPTSRKVTDANHHDCPTCGTPTRRIYDADTCGIPITINATPTTRTAALAAIIGGAKAVVAVTTRGDRGRITVLWRRLNHATIASAWLAGGQHHTELVCGSTHPPAPPTRHVAADLPATPPF